MAKESLLTTKELKLVIARSASVPAWICCCLAILNTLVFLWLSNQQIFWCDAGPYEFSPEQRKEMARFHQVLLTGRRMKSRNGEETTAESQLMHMLQQLRAASPEAAETLAAEVRGTTQGGSRKTNKRKAGERDGPGMRDPVVESEVLPAGFGRYTLVPLENGTRRPHQPPPVNWKVLPSLYTSTPRGFRKQCAAGYSSTM
jgi:hypothetical protein